MPRGRFHSRKFSKDPKIWSLPDDSHRLLYAMIIDWLDREGRIEGDANIIKGQVAPLAKDWTVEKVEQMLQTISKVKKPNGLGLLDFYTVNGIRYIWYSGFHSEQVGLQKDHEAPSEIPPPPSRLTKLLKTNAKVEPVAEDTSFIEELRPKYPHLNLDEEWEKCQKWWKKEGRIMKDPKHAFINWLSKARGSKQPEPVETGDKLDGFKG
ncbi:hypothetical protein LCGC14_2967520 [marine sediment metagenome]|uniref:Uncharacterized protein n=1 Tax=marine sediment metagenome TaxID=412755 RepID=A0A0F8XAC5_9ZZZZ